jgi:nucleotide-binding universal stress UspA family protein
MPHKVLIAFDCSEGSWRAVEYVAQVFGSLPDTEITLLNILPHVPPYFWDEGHILADKEREARQEMMAQWKARQEMMCQKGCDKARDTLALAGILRERLRCVSTPLNADVAGDIIDEAQNGKYDTIVIGRRGSSITGSHLLGSVTTKVVHHVRGCSVTVAA